MYNNYARCWSFTVKPTSTNASLVTNRRCLVKTFVRLKGEWWMMFVWWYQFIRPRGQMDIARDNIGIYIVAKKQVLRGCLWLFGEYCEDEAGIRFLELWATVQFANLFSEGPLFDKNPWQTAAFHQLFFYLSMFLRSFESFVRSGCFNFPFLPQGLISSLDMLS